MPTDYGDFEIKDYGNGNLVIKKGEIAKNEPVMVDPPKCLTGDVFGSKRCTAATSSTRPCGGLKKRGPGLSSTLTKKEGDWLD